MDILQRKIAKSYLTFAEPSSYPEEVGIEAVLRKFITAYNTHNLKDIENNLCESARIETITTGEIFEKKRYVQWLKKVLHKVDFMALDNIVMRRGEGRATAYAIVSVQLINGGFWSVEAIFKFVSEEKKWYIAEVKIPTPRYLLPK